MLRPVPEVGSRSSADVAPGAPGRRSQRMAWAGLVGLAAVASALVLADHPGMAVAVMLLGLLWVARDAVFTWMGGMALMLVVLQFIPSRIYRLPFVSAFDVDPYRLVLLTLLGVWLVAAFAQGRLQLQGTYLDVGVALFVTALALSYVMNASLFGSPPEMTMMVKSTAYVLSFPITYYLIATVVRSPRQALVLVDVSVFSGAVAGVLAVIERTTQYNIFIHLNKLLPMLEYAATPEQLVGAGLRGDALRAAGPTAHPIAFATMLSMLLPLSLARAIHGRSPRVRLLSAACAVLICVGIFMSLSRTGVVGIVVGGVVLFLGLPPQRGLIASAAVAMVGAVQVAFPGVVNTLVQYFTPEFVLSQEVGNRYGRLVDYARSLPYWLDRPLLGRGFNTFSPDRFGYIDNQYLKFLLEIGVLGVVSFLFLMWRATSVPFRVGGRIGGDAGAVLVGCAAAAAVFAVTSATFDTVGFPQVAYLFFAVAGMGAVIVRECGSGASGR